jgi:hypothetical protein
MYSKVRQWPGYSLLFITFSNKSRRNFNMGASIKMNSGGFTNLNGFYYKEETFLNKHKYHDFGKKRHKVFPFW